MQNQTFRTSELALASGLVALGFDYQGTDGDDPRHLDFIFKSHADILVAEAEYYRAELLCEIGAFYNAFRLLKREVYSKRKARSE